MTTTESEIPSAELIVRQGPKPGQKFSLSGVTVSIGREPVNEFAIKDTQISRQHANIMWEGQRFVIQDLGSANGTFVNEERVAAPRALNNGDVIRLGASINLVFKISSPVESENETLKSVKPPPVVAKPPAEPPPGYKASAKGRRKSLFVGIGLLALLALLAAIAALGYFFLWPQPAAARPVVVFRSPQHGEQVDVGQTVTVHVIASDPAKITRMELWINGHLHHAQNSALPEGASPFPLVAYWSPPSAGSHRLTARAFNSDGTRAQASIAIEAMAAVADLDGDGVADGDDACPAEPGPPQADGCPDADRDGILDAEDACPDEAGMPAGDGCPAASEGDRDGDGMLDEADLCPDEPGAPVTEGCPDADDDGVADGVDACPDEPGLLDDGCPPPDRDDDGVLDDIDDCPDEPGSPATEGCPDRDGDGISDDDDACPDEPGSPESEGCPAVSETDRDGDGISDSDDACPDEPGSPFTEGCPDADGDGIPDAADACPHEPGPPENEGCPVMEGGDIGDIEDNDGDGIPNATDACPDEWGVPELAGCPDTDGDGVPDLWDLCPDEPGPPENAGCPAMGVGDRDGDGVADDVDLCPDEPGLPEHAGCPPPGEGEDEDGDGIPDEEETDDGGVGLGDMGFEGTLSVPVELQVLAFEVSDEYDGVYCYPNLAGQGAERYVFESIEERQWNVGSLGSRMLMVTSGEPMDVEVRCGADVVFMEPGGGWGTYYGLGSFTNSHPPEDWDGHVITARSSGGSDGRWFETQYRICFGSCESVAFPPPTARLLHGLGDVRLHWSWGGDRDSIDGFKIYVDGSQTLLAPADAYSASVLGYGPLCGGEDREFYVTAYQGDRESPPSEIKTWRSTPCDRVVRVTFDAFTTFHMGDDEWWAHGNSVGPIYGNFWASGARERRLSFDAVDYGSRWGERDRGYRLRHTRYYPVQSIFDWIQTQMAGCLGEGCALYSGPESNFVTVEVGHLDDLTFGARLMDVDSDNPDDVLLEDEYTIPAGEIRPGRYTIGDGNVELSVLIDVLVGPEAGGGELPDLTITDVTQHEESGQLRIHVFNNAANLNNQDITVNLVRMSTNEQIAMPTWENVSIPSGGWRILQSDSLTLEPSDLRAIVDPDNAIEESNYRNNIYETPIVMRVEFVELSVRNYDTCETIYNNDSEHRFSVWAGHGAADSEITWSGPVRYPERGVVVAERGGAVETQSWSLEGQEQYTFEFEIPADENVYIMASGYEEDILGGDDPMGHILVGYGPRENYGHSPDVYSEQSTGIGTTNCLDPLIPSYMDYFGFSGQWRITRVR